MAAAAAVMIADTTINYNYYNFLAESGLKHNSVCQFFPKTIIQTGEYTNFRQGAEGDSTLILFWTIITESTLDQENR